MCDVPSHLHDHIYWRRESSRSQEVTSSNKAAESRKRQGEQVSSTRDLDEAPQRRHHEDADILLERSSSPQPNPSAPQARLDGVQQEEEESQQEDQRWELHEPMADYVMPLPLWPRPYIFLCSTIRQELKKRSHHLTCITSISRPLVPSYHCLPAEVSVLLHNHHASVLSSRTSITLKAAWSESEPSSHFLSHGHCQQPQV
ncbi:hypothetical protein EXN66_Car009208 [Channa argus]|uniref:Uncharacterized protein n=1 Tax=Channa argus TaxID=215402 RepID=A0A6G1PTE0_CHAAH|nr:hypothetical protein EXN66_Car009208 [Channa argus]